MNIDCPSCGNRVGNYEFLGVNQERQCPTCNAFLIAKTFEKPKGYILYKTLLFISGLLAFISWFYLKTFTYIGLWIIMSSIFNHFHNKRIMKGWKKWKLKK